MAGIGNNRRIKGPNVRLQRSQAYGGLGKQLGSRVASGAITRAQAEKTAKQRQTFKAAFGANWRDKVYGQNVGGLRRGLSGANAGNEQYSAAYKNSLERRKQMLARAKKKLGY